MAAIVFEKPTGRRFRTGINEGPLEREILYGIKEATDADDAEAAFVAAFGGIVPVSYGGLPLSEYDFSEEQKDGVYDGRAIYKIASGGGGSVGENRISFNTSGGTQHISQSLELQAVYPDASGTGYTPGVGTPIAATADEVVGADIPVAVFEWEITHTFDSGDVDATYIATIEALTGQTNDDTFEGRAQGEILFLGASGQQVNDGPWDITFRFATSKNKTGIAIGDITGIDKLGWELLDVHYKKQSIGTGDNARVIMTPFLVLLHRVFEEGDLSALGV